MSVFQKISTGRVKKPLFLCLYSGPGLGKTTFGASFPKPLFFDFEESTHNIDVARIDPRPLSYDEVMADLAEILKEKTITQFQSIIFDTIDELERLIHKDVAESKNKQSIDDIGWQKGFDIAINRWSDFLSICRQIRDKHNIHFLFLAHSFEKGRSDVEKGVTFSRYSMALHKKAADFIFGQVEMVLFAKKDMAIKTMEDRVVAVDIEKRKLFTSLSVHYDAKNRIGLPSSLDMPSKDAFSVLWSAYEKAFNQTAKDISDECYAEIKKIKDTKLAETMEIYVKKAGDDAPSLRLILERIKTYVIGDQNESTK